jgi:hypothetical protein
MLSRNLVRGQDHGLGNLVVLITVGARMSRILLLMDFGKETPLIFILPPENCMDFTRNLRDCYGTGTWIN